jgi:hypothetical protein
MGLLRSPAGINPLATTVFGSGEWALLCCETFIERNFHKTLRTILRAFIARLFNGNAMTVRARSALSRKPRP